MHSIFLQTLLLIDPLVDALGSSAVGSNLAKGQAPISLRDPTFTH